MKKLQIPLEPGKFYHIFNRGNNGDNLFYSHENYRFFLRRLDEYLSPLIDLYAFCLLPNHFHLLIEIKVQDRPLEALHLEDAKLLRKDPVNDAFHRFFTSYSKAVNNQEQRHGSLFENPFKRKNIDSTEYFARLVYYIHANPELHGICGNFKDYPWSSYDRILSGKPTKLKKSEVLNWFDGLENYKLFHEKKQELKTIQDLMLD